MVIHPDNRDVLGDLQPQPVEPCQEAKGQVVVSTQDCGRPVCSYRPCDVHARLDRPPSRQWLKQRESSCGQDFAPSRTSRIRVPCRRHSDIGDATVAQIRQVFGRYYGTCTIVDPRPRPGFTSLRQ